jgi:hypothetical protein
LHKIDAKHLPAYLDECASGLITVKKQFLFRDTIIKLIQTSLLEY